MLILPIFISAAGSPNREFYQIVGGELAPETHLFPGSKVGSPRRERGLGGIHRPPNSLAGNAPPESCRPLGANMPETRKLETLREQNAHEY